jgi:Domain of unknown function (DUF362)
MKNNIGSQHQWKEKAYAFLNRIHVPSRFVFLILGIASTVWILIRVIPKPSRLHYPCMKAATPIAASFISYIVGITSLTFFFKKARQRLVQSKYLLAGGFVVLGLAAGVWTLISSNGTASANVLLQGRQAGNEPIGVAKGIFPGRVVWVHNPDATDKNCTNGSGDYWWMDGNSDQEVISTMFSEGLQNLTGASTDAAAWDSIFRFYNVNHGKGHVGYKSGEKIAIKINLNGINNAQPDRNINTSPQICYAVLYQLTQVAGVAQSDISIGDPACSMNIITYAKCHDAFPDVTYWGNSDGMVHAEPSASPVLISSDPGINHFEDALPQAYLDAAYMINMPVLKKHHRAGISLGSKNHFGSIGAYTGGAWHMHYSLPCPNATGTVTNAEYGIYRCFVDIMGHEDLGGKTILYLVDGIWSSVNWGHPPIKWRMTPFNNDWPSSLFLSFDPVAIESVGYDFLYEEFDENHPTEGLPATENKGPFSRFEGTDDFLHQAADPANWPSGIEYDPEGDGTILESLGTHEHWNNSTDKQYTRNLGTGNGIELVYLAHTPNSIPKNTIASSFDIYPNPVASNATIRFDLQDNALVFLEIYTMDGKLVQTLSQGQLNAGPHEFTWYPEVNSGLFVGRLSVTANGSHKDYTVKIRVDRESLKI